MKSRCLKKTIVFLGKIILLFGIIIALCKIPIIIADKISYKKQKKMDYGTTLDEEDDK